MLDENLQYPFWTSKKGIVFKIQIVNRKRYGRENPCFWKKPGFFHKTWFSGANLGFTSKPWIFQRFGSSRYIYIYIIYIIYISDILYKSQIKSVESGLNPSNENQLSGLAITKSDVQMCSNVTTHKKKTHN